MPDAPLLLQMAATTIQSRANERDNDKTAERSMKATVDAFNALFGHELTETQGWMFMTLLKVARSANGDLQIDDYIDGSAYFALAGECASLTAKQSKENQRAA